MPGPLDCIISKARDGVVSDKALEAIREQIAEIDPDNTAAVTAAQRAVFRLEQSLEARKVYVAQQILAMDRLNERMKPENDPVSRGPKARAMAILGRDVRGQIQGENVESRWHTIRNLAHAEFVDGLERFHTRVLGLKQDKAGLNNVLEELFGGSTGDESAAAIAKSWKEVDKFLWRRFRRAGGDLLPRNDWMLPQTHDALRMVRHGGENGEIWKETIRNSVDRDKMLDRSTGEPMSDARLNEIIDEAWETITLNGWNKVAEQSTRGPGRMALANRHRPERIFHFKSAEKWREYDEKFGSGGHVFDVMVGHIDRMSREIALMEVMGPNPEATLDMIQVAVQKENAELGRASMRNRFIRRTSLDDADAEDVQDVFNELTGVTESPGSNMLAVRFQAIRNTLTAAQLGGAAVSAITDWNFLHLAARFNGLRTSKVFTRAMRQFVAGDFGGDMTFAAKVGLGAESWAGTALGAQRFAGELMGPRWSRVLADAVMRATFLTPWTQAGRHAFGLENLSYMAEEVSRGAGFTDLNPRYREMLEKRNFSEADWEVVKQTRMDIHRGVKYVNLTALAKKDPKISAKLQQAIQEETEFAIPTSSARARAQLKMGTRAGTWKGEIFRSVALYKSFPVTLMHTHVWRATMDKNRDMSQLNYAAQLFLWTTLMGAVAMQSKHVLKGNGPMQTGFEDDDREQMAKFMMAAALQGGALGIAGDFLFKDISRFGFDPVTQALGPVAGAFSDTLKLTLGNAIQAARGDDTNAGREAVQMLRRYTPGSSVWYARLALERSIFDNMQRMVDPDADKAFRRKRNTARKDLGTKPWWGPGEALP